MKKNLTSETKMIKLKDLLEANPPKISWAAKRAASSQPHGQKFMWHDRSKNGRYNVKAYRLGEPGPNGKWELRVNDTKTHKTKGYKFSNEREIFQFWQKARNQEIIEAGPAPKSGIHSRKHDMKKADHANKRFMWSYQTHNKKYSAKAVRLGKTLSSPIELTITNNETGKSQTDIYPSEALAKNAWRSLHKANLR